MPALRDLGNEVVLLFANSNIDTEAEFEKRLAEARKLGAAEGVEVFALPYDHAEWMEQVAKGFEDAPEKGARCARCFHYNLAKAAAWAAERGYEAFTTSLTVSPHKVSRMVFEAGRDCATGTVAPPVKNARLGVEDVPSHIAFLEVDFKKKDGFLKSLRRTEELGLYRQSYCGCEFSKR